MIKINDRFSIEKDPYCWVLYETKKGKSRKTGKEAVSQKSTYHANIPQICEAILSKSGGEYKTIEDLKDLFENAVERLTETIQNKIKLPRRKKKRVRGSI